MGNNINGIINVYKPSGFTSFQVVSILKRILKVKKIGHTGTLDPQAEGVLVICVGEATKVASIISKTKKVYDAEIIFGIETDTWDMEGRVLEERRCREIKKKIEGVLPQFQGEIEQIPPMYSAISYKGERLYNLARKGKVVERKPRKIRIYKLELLEYNEKEKPKIRLLIECSSGTYIRSLAHDIGVKVDCPATLSKLIRKMVGKFPVEESFSIEEIEDYTKRGKIDSFLISIKDALNFLETLNVKKEEKEKIKKGQFISISEERARKTGSSLILALYGEEPVSIGELVNHGNKYIFKPKRVFNI